MKNHGYEALKSFEPFQEPPELQKPLALNSVRNAMVEATELSIAVESLVSRLIGGGVVSESKDPPSANAKSAILPELQDFADRTTDRVREAATELRRLEKELGE